MNKELVEMTRQQVRGMRQADALNLIRANGLIGQVLSTDGIQIAIAERHTPNRINLEVINGIVRDATVG